MQQKIKSKKNPCARSQMRPGLVLIMFISILASIKGRADVVLI